VVASLLAAHRGWGRQWAPSNMFTALRMWYSHITAARKGLERLPSHLGLTLRYEDLVTATEETLSAVFSFLGLTVSSEELAVLIEKNAISSNNSKRNPLKVFGAVGAELQGVLEEPEGFVRKGKPGSWREDIGWFRGMAIKSLVANEMKRYGYR